jgi:triphosphoribosyl-dephospho-CoA synthase
MTATRTLTHPDHAFASPEVPVFMLKAWTAEERRSFSLHAARIAVASLYDELVLYPKPGLVSLVDNGSHDDMTAQTFFRSLFSLRGYFIRITEAGMRKAPFHELKQLGMDAESRMLRATGGINTHRGAIFALGLLCAAAGHCHRRRLPLSSANIRAALTTVWGADLAMHARQCAGHSHGLQVARQYAASGAREEAALGMPAVFDLALPAMQATLAASGCWERARIDALFSLMAHISDTNVYFRGGEDGARMVSECAAGFLARGGTAAADWRSHALACHERFVAHRLSPGGAADLLGAACFVHRIGRQAMDGRRRHP